MFNIPQYAECRKRFLAGIRFVLFLLFPRFVDIKLVLTLRAAKFIPFPACDKGFFTVLAHTHITVLIRKHERKAHLHHDEQGKHVRTKKEILDDDGNVRKGCKIIKKGEVYERKIFTTKDGRFKQEVFLDEAKVFYTDLINQMVLNDKDRLSIFDKTNRTLPLRK